jgi:hypothetical protein
MDARECDAIGLVLTRHARRRSGFLCYRNSLSTRCVCLDDSAIHSASSNSRETNAMSTTIDLQGNALVRKRTESSCRAIS